ncbi:MAG: hypothetical protein U0694_08985 [Anaerolineae bacterium]
MSVRLRWVFASSSSAAEAHDARVELGRYAEVLAEQAVNGANRVAYVGAKVMHGHCAALLLNLLGNGAAEAVRRREV